jgi:uncharacterized protein with HEPN domain
MDKSFDEFIQVEWRKIAGLRDIVAHGYFGIDYEILWDIIQNKIPDLVLKIQEVIEGETGDERIKIRQNTDSSVLRR